MVVGLEFVESLESTCDAVEEPTLNENDLPAPASTNSRKSKKKLEIPMGTGDGLQTRRWGCIYTALGFERIDQPAR
jgi:hypothetical protein